MFLSEESTHAKYQTRGGTWADPSCAIDGNTHPLVEPAHVVAVTLPLLGASQKASITGVGREGASKE